MKLATWNVALPVSPLRRAEMLTHTDRERADVWVLTETHNGFRPGHPFSHSSAAGRDGLHKEGHRWVTIWSRHRLEPVATSDDKRTAAARVFPESGEPFVVYGTVLPWIGSPWRGNPSAGGIAFREALAVQKEDWLRIRDDYPDDERFVLGDLNQDLADSHYYGSRANRATLETALEEAGLVALTAGAADPARRDSPRCASIDHVCARRDSKWRAEPAVRWPDLAVPDKRLSDHFGVSILFKRR
jgi:hypothetical protein